MTNKTCCKPITDVALNFRQAKQEDTADILSLYQNAKFEDFSVWDENYPTIKELEHDLETDNLYVMTCGGKVVGAISIVPENEMDNLDCWTHKDGKEIARIVVDRDYHGKGIAYRMVQNIETFINEKGYSAIRLSVAKINIPAYKTYMKAGFNLVGEAFMYGDMYYILEKAINTDSSRL